MLPKVEAVCADKSTTRNRDMETATTARSSFFGLFKALTGDTKALIRQEIQLAKTELSEKISTMEKNAVALAIGGFVAYAGFIVLLIGLGWLLAWAFHLGGLQPIFAGFLGLAVIGLLVVVTGCVLLLKGLKTLRRTSIAPERTIHTIQELRTGTAIESPSQTEPSQKVSSEQMQARVEATEQRVGDTLDELGRRLSPSHINAQVKHRIRENPMQTGLVAAGAGLLSGLILRRKFRHS
jgi:ElaB/YqjD/DUF883 family membrane-anchored ribosome-binding protein